MAGISPVANYAQSNFTSDTATAYKTKIDANSMAAQRVADSFAPHQLATAAMMVALQPGHLFAGTTLTEVGAQTTITTTSGSATATVSSATGISNGMVVSAAGVPNNTTATISGTTVTLSANATASATVPATFMQVTGTITAPGGNPRIDRVVIDRLTGALSVITGTPAATPSPPAITSGKVPVCQILLQTSSTSITNSMLTDERDFSALGHGTAGEYDVGTGPNNVVQLDGSSKLPAVDGSQLTGIVAVPTGVGMDFFGPTAPSGFIFAYGQAISRTTFAALFAVIGTAYGPGNGSTTFNVPDKRGRASFGKDDMGGSAAGRLTNASMSPDGVTLGATGGAETHTNTINEMAAHTHVASAYKINVGSSGNTLDKYNADGNLASQGSAVANPTTGSAGGGAAYSILPPGIVCNYILKT
jgi:microcystin-dependent protein